MSFTAATCLTNTGSVNLIDPISFYSDKTKFLVPFTSATLTEITSSNCPYIIRNIPNGTKIVRLVSENGYCVDIDIQCDNICDICDLNFKNYNTVSTTIAKITAGDLTGSCQNQITEYLVYWYGPNTNTSPNNTNNFVFSSGKGNSFSYEYPHPINVPAQDGVYKPVIQKIKLNDKWFSLSGGTGFIPANLNCIDPIAVLPCNCSNNTNTTNFKTQYNHYVNFDITSGKIPSPVEVALVLNAGTKFVPWTFLGLERSDRVQLYFSGSAYSNVLGLEDYLIGSDLPQSNININSFPKSADTNTYYNKITSLNGLTVNNGDRVIFRVIPKENTTSWTLFYTCLQNWDCDECITTSSYKIIKNLLTGYTVSGNTIILNMGGLQISGCSVDNANKSPLNLYYNQSDSLGPRLWYLTPNTPGGYINHSLFTEQEKMSWSKRFCQTAGTNRPITCNSYGSPITVGFEKSSLNTNILVISGNTNAINDYYNSYLSMLQVTSGDTVTNNTDIDYYAYIALQLPKTNTSICDDSFQINTFNVHTSSKYQKGVSSGVDWLRITANTVSYGLNVTPDYLNCQDSAVGIINNLNQQATGSTLNNFTSQNGVVPKNLALAGIYLFSAQTVNTAQTFTGYYQIFDTEMSTTPFISGTTTLLPQYSGITCQKYTQIGLTNNVAFTNRSYHVIYKFEIRLTNPSDPRDFDVYADQIINDVAQNNYQLVLRWSGGAFSNINPNFVI